MKLKTLKFGFIALCMAFLACTNSGEKAIIPVIPGDLQDIMKRGKLVVLMENSPVSSFNYRGKDIGFEYEMLSSFAKTLGIQLEVKLIESYDNMEVALKDQDVDLISSNLVVNNTVSKEIQFSSPFLRTDQVVIQRKRSKVSLEKKQDIASTFIQDPLQLARKKIYVRKNSYQSIRMKNLQTEMGDTLFLEEDENQVSEEDLIEMVSTGQIDYTISARNLAQANKQFFPNIDFSTSVGIKQNIAFGMRKNARLLKLKLDEWLNRFVSQQTFIFLKNKYFGEIQMIEEEIDEKTKIPRIKVNTPKGALSPYDAFFKASAKKYNFDWRLLAAVSCKESRFNPNARGYGGSYGMMQFMPNTGPSFGVFENSTPQQQIEGGMKYLNKLYAMWKSVPDKIQRQKFMLASYNAGNGHIEDGQRLARKNGLDPNIWDGNVEKMIGELSKPEFYKDPVVKCGSLRGRITLNYVTTIFQYLEAYQAKYKP